MTTFVSRTEHQALVKSTTKIISNFVAFSESPNFTKISTYLVARHVADLWFVLIPTKNIWRTKHLSLDGTYDVLIKVLFEFAQRNATYNWKFKSGKQFCLISDFQTWIITMSKMINNFLLQTQFLNKISKFQFKSESNTWKIK